MPSNLSKTQKRDLSKLATRAWRLENAKARGRGEKPDTSTAAATAYRHEQVAKAVNKAGLTCCSQADFLPLIAHFEDILGNSGRALNAHMQSQTDSLRRVQWLLNSEIAKARLTTAYAAKICIDQNKCTLDNASEAQLWRLVYTIRNRRK